MKTKLYILCCLLGFFSMSVKGQNELKWRILPAAPYTNYFRFEDISFINENSGWAIRSYTVNANDCTYVHKTIDGGLSWINITDQNFKALRSIGFADSLNGWIGTLAWPGVSMFRTTNGGINWSNTISNPPADSLGVCGISVVDKNFVFACGRYFGPARFFKTTNGGNNWTVKNLSPQITTLIDCHFFNKDSGFVVGGTGSLFSTRSGTVLFTSDGGESWVNRFTTPPRGQWCWKISFPDKLHGFVSLEKIGSGPVYFLKTTNGGETWEEKMFLQSFEDEEGIGFINSSTGWIGGWRFNTYKTTDGGESWNPDPWGFNLNRVRILSDTLAFAVGSHIYKFSRDSIVNINQIVISIPHKFSLYQNYPNPFNPITRIRFDVTRDAGNGTRDVKLVVYDALGRGIQTLLNQRLAPGSYETEFNGGDFSSGIYFYSLLVDGSLVDTKRMILLK